MPIKQKTLQGKTAAPAPNKKVATSQPDPGEGGGLSEAEVFDNTKPRGEIASGRYESIIIDAVLQDKDAKGRSARIVHEIASDNEYQGQTITQFYKLLEADGSAAQGSQFFKADMIKLGYEDIKFADIPEAFADIMEKHLGCIIQVKKGPQYTNAFLAGLAEGSEVIAAYLEKRGF